MRQYLSFSYKLITQIGDEGVQYLGEALQKNPVRQNQSLHFFHFHLSLFIQTLTHLGLYNNQIGDKGAQSIGKALQKNTVRQNQSLHFFHFHLSLFIQTLTYLYLYSNQIGDKGAQSIGEAFLKLFYPVA